MSEKKILDRLAHLAQVVGRIEERQMAIGEKPRKHTEGQWKIGVLRQQDERLVSLLEPVKGVGPRMFLLSTLSDLWDIPRPTLMDEVKEGRLPAKKIKNRLRILADDAIKWRDEHMEDRVPRTRRSPASRRHLTS